MSPAAASGTGDGAVGSGHRNKPQDSLRLTPKTSGVSAEEIRKLCFRTTSKSCFIGRPLPSDGRTENLAAVFSIGQKTSKYLKYQQKKAPLLDRSACCYSKDYIQLPLGDNIINTQLAKNFKDGFKSGPSGIDAKMATSTKYSEDFKPPSKRQQRAARGKSAKPTPGDVRTSSVPTGPMLEVTSLSHKHFVPPNLELCKQEPAKPPKGNLGSKSRCAPPVTSYSDDFCGGATKAADPIPKVPPPPTPNWGALGAFGGSRPASAATLRAPEASGARGAGSRPLSAAAPVKKTPAEATLRAPEASGARGAGSRPMSAAAPGKKTPPQQQRQQAPQLQAESRPKSAPLGRRPGAGSAAQLLRGARVVSDSELSACAPSALGPSPTELVAAKLAPADSDIWKVRRVGYMAPGA